MQNGDVGERGTGAGVTNSSVEGESYIPLDHERRAVTTTEGTNALATLGEERFASFVDRFASAVWADWEVERSPQSPDGGLDLVLTDDGTVRLVHIRQYPPSNPVSAPAVRDLAALREEYPYDEVLLVATGDFTAAARTAAAETRVELWDGETFVQRARDAGVDLPSPPTDEFDLGRFVTNRTAYWPDALAERAAEVTFAIDALGSFEYRIARGTAGTDLDFCPQGTEVTAARVRFTDTSCLVYARAEDDAMRPAVRLTATREHQPPLSDLDLDLIERAVQSVAESTDGAAASDEDSGSVVDDEDDSTGSNAH